MSTPPVADDIIAERVATYLAHDKNQSATAQALGISRGAVQDSLKRAAERGLLGPQETLPGFAIKSLSSKASDGTWVRQGRATGEVVELPDTHMLGKMTVNRDAEGRLIQDWIRLEPTDYAQAAALEAAKQAFKDELPRASAVPAPAHTESDLLNQYTITDNHLGALAWNEETGSGDYDLRIGERLIIDWFAAAIAQSPAGSWLASHMMTSTSSCFSSNMRTTVRTIRIAARTLFG